MKTQISYAANLFGLAEEEHAGGALVFPSYDLGEEMIGRKHMPRLDYSFDEVVKLYGDIMEVHPDGYGVDRRNPSVIYVSEHVQFDLRARWDTNERAAQMWRALLRNTRGPTS